MSRHPKAVVSAMLAAGKTVGGIKLREFTAGTSLLLQKLGHPLSVDPDTRPAMTDMDVMIMVYVLTHTAAECNALVDQGRPAFDAAVIEFSDTIPMDQLPALGAAINELLERAVSTVGGGAQKKTQGTTPSTTSPPPAAGVAGS